jgi:hypothetical protein
MRHTYTPSMPVCWMFPTVQEVTEARRRVNIKRALRRAGLTVDASAPTDALLAYARRYVAIRTGGKR